jgi:hypothetical protein
LADQTFRTGLVEDDSAVGETVDGIRHAGGNVGLDDTSDDVHRWPLRGQDEMDSDGASLLRQDRQGRLDFGLHCHHEVRQLIDDHNNEGQYPFAVNLLDGRLGRSVGRFGVD